MPRLDNSKHEIIAQRLAEGDTQTKALIAAGYSAKSAGQTAVGVLKKNPAIRQRCAEIRAAKQAIEDRFNASREGKKEITRSYVRGTLQEVAERCMQHEPILVKGIPTGEYSFDAAGATRAVELLGKDLGMFVERKEIGLPGSFASVEERKAAEQRLKLKMVRLGMARPARLIGSGTAVETPTVEPVVENSTTEVEAPDQTGEPEPEAPSTEAERDLAPLPPGILEPDRDQPDPVMADRLKPAPVVASKPVEISTQEVQAVQKIPGWGRKPYEPPAPRPPLGPDPGPGPERGAWRNELRRRANLDVRDGTPNTRDRHGHPLK